MGMSSGDQAEPHFEQAVEIGGVTPDNPGVATPAHRLIAIATRTMSTHTNLDNHTVFLNALLTKR